MSVIAMSRAIGPVPISCVLTEKHESSIEISEIPIETGSRISDHAYVRPKRVTLDVADANAAATYAALVRFQESRVPFVLVTGLSVYKDMLVKSIDVARGAGHSRVLSAKVECQEVIIVSTAYASGASKAGNAGGSKSTKAATASKGAAGDAATANRASGTATSGDAAATAATAATVPCMPGMPTKRSSVPG